jgi:hypothetical protein
VKLTTLLLTFLLGATVAFAQGSPAPAGLPDVVGKFAGTYEGTVKGQRVILDLKTQDGKFGGSLKNGDKSYALTEGLFSDETLSLSFGKDAKLVGKVVGDKFIGDLTIGTEKSPVELKTVVPTSSAGSAAPAAATAPMNLSGDWEAVADANGQPFPFLLTLKIDGEKVTGGSSSQLGEGTIKEGSWKDGKLTFQIEGTNGTISMSATVIEGKLSGEFDYAGQLSGKWVAVRKNP